MTPSTKPVLSALLLAALACGGTDANKSGSDVTDLTAAEYTLPPSAVVEVTPNASAVRIGKTVKLATSVVDAEGRQMNSVMGALAHWRSSDTTVATVSVTGLVTGHKKGHATISAVTGHKVASSEVTVSDDDHTAPSDAPSDTAGPPATTTTTSTATEPDHTTTTATATTPPATVSDATPTAPTAPEPTAPPAATAPPPVLTPPPVVTTPPIVSSPPPTTVPVSQSGLSSDEPLPRTGDRLLLDGRTSMQRATSLANLWPGSYEVEGNLAFTANMDGLGTHALRIDWASFNGKCGDSGAHMRNYLPQPYSKHIIMSWKQRLGRTPTGGGIGNVNSFQITNSGNGCDANAGRKELLVCRDNADGGCYDRMDYLWPGPAPVSPRVDNNNQNLNFNVLPGAQFNPQSHVGETIIQTVELKAESSTGASDGIVRVWINGIKIIENTHARIGAEAFNRTELPSTFNSPAQDQSEYIWDVVAWVPQG